MCQLCSVKDLAKRDRWPKPLEHCQADIELLVTSSHNDYHKFKTQGSSDTNNAAHAKAALLDNLRTLADLLEEVEVDRQKRLRLWTTYLQQMISTILRILTTRILPGRRFGFEKPRTRLGPSQCLLRREV